MSLVLVATPKPLEATVSDYTARYVIQPAQFAGCLCQIETSMIYRGKVSMVTSNSSTKATGTVKWFDNAKGYGSIDGPDGDVMVHWHQTGVRLHSQSTNLKSNSSTLLKVARFGGDGNGRVAQTAFSTARSNSKPAFVHVSTWTSTTSFG